ncbi:MAG: transposase [Deltaproteobacteria bacterium]
MRKIRLFTGEFYHVYNRGADKRAIFLDRADYLRFKLGLKEFNTRKRIFHLKHPVATRLRQEDELVDICCYCLLPNHFHLVLKQEQPEGISSFMQKVGTGYAQYFNKRYMRTGVLFQGPFKAKHVESDAHMLELSRYVHLNPWGLAEGHKREAKERYLVSYPWSSFKSYAQRSHKDGLIGAQEIILGQFGFNRSLYKDFVLQSDTSKPS